MRGLTRWVRLRLRVPLWRQWKTPRRRRQLRWNSGCIRDWQATRLVWLGPWYLATAKVPSAGFSANAYLKALGLRSLFEEYLRKPTLTAADPNARWWQGSAGDRRPYAYAVAIPHIGAMAQALLESINQQIDIVVE